ICYYEARIKHFGDTSTPWSKGETVNDGAQKHEGRYGVVRNNWYELNVTGISAIGSAEIPTDEPTDPTNPDNPDDEQDQYIAFQINILSWAKRTQDVEL
ncbi:MAG: Mfa1 fimbrilin C-terminal domain-containing protein, partial [Prevotella sp.]|nr:Mfa1 fimbrilin C-terminal domain-containing protein [Prevotella sp.]